MHSLPGRSVLAAAGIALFAIGLAHRVGFFSWVGVLLLLTGMLLVVLAALLPVNGPEPFPLLLVFLGLTAALAPFDPVGINIPEAALVVAGLVAFYVFGAPRLRQYRVPVVAGLLVAGHVLFLLRWPLPQHQDVFLFLNGGVETLLKGSNPYRGVPAVDAGVRKLMTFTYPPGALITLLPFRAFLGDVRWAYPLAELGMALTWWILLRRRGLLSRPVDALVLVPLVLPRTSQAFYIYSNHDLVLLALVLAALALRSGTAWVAAAAALGLAISGKQYVLVFPVLFLLPILGRRVSAWALVFAAVVVLSFLAWDAAALIRSTTGNLVSVAPDPDRLTFYAMSAHLGVPFPRAIQAALSASALLVALAAAYRCRRGPAMSLVASGVCLWLFALASPFSAYNYFAYGLFFVCWGLLVSLAPGVLQPGQAPAGALRARPAAV